MGSLKELLADLYTPEIEAKIGQNQIYIWSKDKADTEPIPKFRVNEMLETSKNKVTDLEKQVASLEESLGGRDKQLKDLKKAAEGNTDLQKTIEDLQKTNKEQRDSFDLERQNLKAKEVAMNKTFAIKEGLLNAGVVDPEARDLLSKKFDINKIEIEDGKVKGFEDMLKPIKENKAFAGFFGEEVIAGQQHHQGAQTPGNKSFYTEEEVRNMSQEQVIENIDVINKSMTKW